MDEDEEEEYDKKIVLDCGSLLTKCGLAGHDCPQVFETQLNGVHPVKRGRLLSEDYWHEMEEIWWVLRPSLALTTA